MLYFDLRPALRRLSPEERGLLFEAILDYGEHGVLPEFDGGLGIAWDFIQPRIDQDAMRYEEKLLKNRYAVYVREAKKAGAQPMEFEIWRTDPDSCYREISSDSNRYPTTTPTPTAIPTPTTNTDSKSDSKAEAEGCRGDNEAEFNRRRNEALQALTEWRMQNANRL